MQGTIQRSVCAGLAVIALCLTGAAMQCPWKRVKVEIPDYEVNEIQGLQFWRADQEGSLQLTEASRVVFGRHVFSNNTEAVEYTMVDSRNEPVEIFSPATVVQREDTTGALTLSFVFSTWNEPPGWVRVTTFNAVGESEVSDDAVFL
jgi:hypothetical protein